MDDIDRVLEDLRILDIDISSIKKCQDQLEALQERLAENRTNLAALRVDSKDYEVKSQILSNTFHALELQVQNAETELSKAIKATRLKAYEAGHDLAGACRAKIAEIDGATVSLLMDGLKSLQTRYSVTDEALDRMDRVNAIARDYELTPIGLNVGLPWKPSSSLPSFGEAVSAWFKRFGDMAAGGAFQGDPLDWFSRRI